jgi:hypothetical protein
MIGGTSEFGDDVLEDVPILSYVEQIERYISQAL